MFRKLHYDGVGDQDGRAEDSRDTTAHAISNPKATPTRAVETDYSSSKGLTRPISPPSLGRKRPAGSNPSGTENELDDPTVQGNRTLPWVYHKDKRRAIYMNVSEEAELEMAINNPRRFGLSSAPRQHASASGALSEKLAQVIRETTKTMKPDQGGFVSIDYVDDKAEDVQIKEPLASSSQTSEPEQSILCQYCQKIVRESEVINRPWRRVVSVNKDGPVTIQEEEKVEFHGRKVNVFTHHRYLGALRISTLGGCHLCSLLDAYDIANPIIYDETSTTTYVVKVIYAQYHDEGPGVLVLQAKGLPTKATHLMYEESGRKFTKTLGSTQTDAESVLKLARRWLNTCLEKHEACRARATALTAFLPTRLVEVQCVGKTIKSLKLCLGGGLPPDTKYLALSHCWGGADIIKLTKATLDPFLTGIPPDRLPKNFTDAVIITSLLGYKYIWVDSLCICQDSPEDWRDEAARMGSVYRHAACTIAAVGSKDSHGGCFATRSSLSFMPCQLIPKTHKKPGVYAENWHRQPQPLHTRAWVVQERCLSIRTLNFGSNMLSWDCISAVASEQQPDMESTSVEASLKRTFIDLLDQPVTPSQERARGRSDWINAWWKLIGEYSSCNLTYATDKWPAMKGLATEVEKERGLRLVHGLWEHNLADELLWMVSDPRKKRLDIGAPSWSWLSVEGEVHRRRYNLDMGFELDATVALLNASSASTQPSGSQTNLQNSPNEIRVTARPLPLRWVLRATDCDQTPSYNFRLLDNRHNTTTTSGLNIWHGRWIPDTIADETWETWALQIVTSDVYELKTRVGLVVVPVEGRENVWRRVGFYEFSWRDESHRDKGVEKRWFGYEKNVTLV